MLCFSSDIGCFIGQHTSPHSAVNDTLFQVFAEYRVVRMSAEQHFIRKLTGGRQKGIYIAFPAFAYDHSERVSRFCEFSAKPDTNLMFDKKLISKIICRID